VNPRFRAIAGGCAVALLCGGSGGCATYQRRDLALDAHVADWSRQALDGVEIHRYYDELRQRAESPPAASPTAETPPFDPSDGLSRAEAEAVALHFNPTLRRARADAGVALAGAKEAGWWPDPQLEAQILRFANRGRKTRFRYQGRSFDGVNTGIISDRGLDPSGIEFSRQGVRRVEGDFIDDPWIIGGSLSLTIPISGRMKIEQDLRWSQYSAAWRQAAIAEWRVVTQVRTAWIDWSAACERVALVRAYVDRLSAIAERTDRLADAGELKTTESRLLRVEWQSRRAALLSLENAAEQARLALLQLLGVAPDAPLTLTPELAAREVAFDADSRRDALLRDNPLVRAAVAEHDVSEQQLRLEVRKQIPDLNLGPSYSFEEGFSRAGIGIGFPIPLWNRNRQAIAEATADRDAAAVRAETTVEVALQELAQVASRLDFAQRRTALLESDVLPLTEQQLDETRTLLDLGEVNVLVLRDALRSALETQLELLDAVVERARARVALRQMVQPAWTTPQPAHRDKPPENQPREKERS
jgi:outer membrane protein TolC